jgi:hypothetical protein
VEIQISDQELCIWVSALSFTAISSAFMCETVVTHIGKNQSKALNKQIKGKIRSGLSAGQKRKHKVIPKTELVIHALDSSVSNRFTELFLAVLEFGYYSFVVQR